MAQSNFHMAEYDKYLTLFNKYKAEAKCVVPVPVKPIISVTTNYKLLILKQSNNGGVPVVVSSISKTTTSSNNDKKVNINVLPSLIG